MYNQGKGKSTVKCHICDAELVSPKTDPLNSKALLPCEDCMTVIEDTVYSYQTNEEDSDIPEELEYDEYDEYDDNFLEPEDHLDE